MYVHDKTCLCICYHILPVHVGVAFTTSNVQKAVERVKRVWCRYVGDFGLASRLSVPSSKKDEIQRKFSHLPQQKQALIKYWKDRNPMASWRSLIATLDEIEEKRVADDIRHLAEPLSGVYKCTL